MFEVQELNAVRLERISTPGVRLKRAAAWQRRRPAATGGEQPEGEIDKEVNTQ
jgi:hypothetical protein